MWLMWTDANFFFAAFSFPPSSCHLFNRSSFSTRSFIRIQSDDDDDDDVVLLLVKILLMFMHLVCVAIDCKTPKQIEYSTMKISQNIHLICKILLWICCCFFHSHVGFRFIFLFVFFFLLFINLGAVAHILPVHFIFVYYVNVE